jgi:hypothetical protein
MPAPLSLATRSAAHLSLALGGYHVGSGRAVPSVAALVGLVSVIVGGLVTARSARGSGAGNRRTGAVWALVLGLISLLVGGLHTANSAGGFGTGNGLAGALVALVLGLVGMLLGSLALVRTRRAG